MMDNVRKAAKKELKERTSETQRERGLEDMINSFWCNKRAPLAIVRLYLRVSDKVAEKISIGNPRNLTLDLSDTELETSLVYVVAFQ